jgi:hypothetical protein
MDCIHEEKRDTFLNSANNIVYTDSWKMEPSIYTETVQFSTSVESGIRSAPSSIVLSNPNFHLRSSDTQRELSDQLFRCQKNVLGLSQISNPQIYSMNRPHSPPPIYQPPESEEVIR